MLVVDAGLDREEVVPEIEEAFVQDREVVLGEVGFGKAVAVGSADADAGEGGLVAEWSSRQTSTGTEEGVQK